MGGQSGYESPAPNLPEQKWRSPTPVAIAFRSQDTLEGNLAWEAGIQLPREEQIYDQVGDRLHHFNRISVVDGNPLNDIAATRNVGMVIKDGKVLDTAYNPHFQNPIPRPTR